MPRQLQRVKGFFGGLGPGLVAGASDNDPTSVAALSVIGATTVYGLLWLVVLLLPMLVIIQVTSARMGVVTRSSLQEIIRSRFGRAWSITAMVMVVLVTLITLTADLEGGAAAISLLAGGNWRYYVGLLAALAIAILVLGSYRLVQRYLRVVALVFIAYIAAGLLARPDWWQVLQGTFVPRLHFSPQYIAGALALLGSTLTSYVYFWETIEEEEEGPPLSLLRRVELDAAIGIVFVTVIFWFIVVSSGATAGVRHMPIATAQNAAIVLRPVAGPYAEVVFAIGLLASALLALPVLAATIGYVTIQAFDGTCSIKEPISRSNAVFYMIISSSLIAGAVLAFAGIEPIRLLFIASIAGGLGTPPLLILLFKAAADERVMGKDRVRGWLRAAGWFTALVVSAASAVYVAYQFFP